MNIARAAGWTGAETDVYAADATPSFWQSPQMLTVGIGHLVLLERLRVQSRLFKIRNAPTKAASTEVKGRLPSMTKFKSRWRKRLTTCTPKENRV